MLPELIYREEKHEDFKLLFALAVASVFTGYFIADMVFSGILDIMAVVFATIPLMYPLTRYFLDEENESAPHIPEIQVYGTLFSGIVVGFFILGYFNEPQVFAAQFVEFKTSLLNMGVSTVDGSSVADITGYATSKVGLIDIILNNLFIFAAIIGIAALIGSSGALILTWNASVLGVFFATLVKAVENSGGLLRCSPVPSPLCYAPHTFFEMTGFVIAGVSGSLISAAVYREHFDSETWKDYAKLVALGVLMILIGAILETA